YERAGLVSEAVPYQVRAGDAARQRYANETAIGYYRRALPHLPESERVQVMLNLGQVLEFVGKWDEAEALYRQALELSDCLENAHSRARCELTLGVLLHHKGEDGEALSWLKYAKSDFEAAEDLEGTGNVLENVGLIHNWQGDYPRALEAHQQHLGIAAKLNNPYEMSQAFGNLGVVYWQQGNYERAMGFYQRQYEIAKQIGDPLGMSRALGRKGVCYREQGDLGRALATFQERLKLSEEIGDQLGVSYALGDIGLVYYAQGELARALAHLTRQLELAQQFGAQRGISQGLRNMGLLYLDHGDCARANVAFTTSLQIALQIGDRRMVGYTVGDLADVYRADGRRREAEPLDARAATLLRELNIPYFLCERLCSMADALFAEGHAAKAQALAAEAAKIADGIGRNDIRFRAQVLATRLRAATSPAAKASGIVKLQARLAETTDENEQAELDYALWQLNKAQTNWRKAAAKLYRKMHSQMPKRLYRERYVELADGPLPDPLPLPALSVVNGREAPILQDLLEQVDDVIARLKPPKRK
ncbi:MAG: tetratricopeptide repeat protein, partial [Chloroflexi bacterium]|nr:tetratricopeptide repeat protein [Chloroflexota bacterium]